MQKKVLLSNWSFTTAKLSSHGAWGEYISVVEFQLSLRYIREGHKVVEKPENSSMVLEPLSKNYTGAPVKIYIFHDFFCLYSRGF